MPTLSQILQCKWTSWCTSLIEWWYLIYLQNFVIQQLSCQMWNVYWKSMMGTSFVNWCCLLNCCRHMISPIKTQGQIHFLTKGGNVDRGNKKDFSFIDTLCLYQELERYLLNTNHEAFADHIISQHKTPIYEFISESRTHSVKYKENSLILLAIRDNVTGNLVFNAHIWHIHFKDNTRHTMTWKKKLLYLILLVCLFNYMGVFD